MLKALLSTLAVLTLGSLYADPHPGPGHVGILGEYIYMYPNVDEVPFVINSPVAVGPLSDTPDLLSGKRETHQLRPRNAFRVGLAFGLGCGLDTSLYYTRLHARHRKNVSGNFLVPTQGRPEVIVALEGDSSYAGLAAAKADLLYERFDKFLTQKFWEHGAANARFMFGFEGAYIRLREEILYIPTGPLVSASVARKTRTWGVGPEVGFELNYGFSFLPDGFSLNVITTGSLLTGKTSSKEVDRERIPGVAPLALITDVADKDYWRVIPALHSRFALNYNVEVAGYGAAIQIGYEISSYIRALRKIQFNELDFRGLSANNWYNFDVQGVFANVSVGF